MAIDLTRTDEPRLNLRQAASYFASARGDRPAHTGRVLRYILKGCLAPDGTRVYLDALRQGNQWVTTPSAIQAFAEALTPQRAESRPGTRSPHPREKTSARQSAERTALALDAAGFA